VKQNSRYYAGALILQIAMSCVSLCYGASLFAKTDPTIEKIQALLTNKTDIAQNTAEALVTLNDIPAEKNEVLIPWLKKNERRLPAPFTMSLGSRLYLTDPQEGLRWYMLGRIRSSYDIARCADPTASQFGLMVGMLYSSKLDEYMNSHRQELLTAWQDALTWEKGHSYQGSPLWVCSQGEQDNRPPQANENDLIPKVLPKEKWPAIYAKTIQNSVAALKNQQIEPQNQ